MRWFGDSWGVSVNRKFKRMSVPHGAHCGHCGASIASSDRGVAIPYLGDAADWLDGTLVNVHGEPHVPYHLQCFHKEIGLDAAQCTIS